MFEDKDYKFSFKKLQACMAKEGHPIGDWARTCDGARVNVNKTRTQGVLHGYVGSPTMMIINGRPQMQRKEVAYLVEPEWCLTV